MIMIKRIENLFMNISYYEVKRLVFEIIKNKKVSLYLLLRLNTSLLSRLLRQLYKLHDGFKNYIFEFSKTIRFVYSTIIKIILPLLRFLNIINASNTSIFNIITCERS